MPPGTDRHENLLAFNAGSTSTKLALYATGAGPGRWVATVDHVGRPAPGSYGVAFASGLADVDAILVSSVQMLAQGELTTAATATAILLAAVANMLTKAVLSRTIGGRAVGTRVTAGYLAVAAAGLLAAAIGAP